MNKESTDKLAIDTNQNIPRVLMQGSKTLTTDNVDPIFGFRSADSINLDELRIDANTEYDFYIKTPGESRLYKLPVTRLQTANGTIDFSAKCWLSVFPGASTVLAFDVFQSSTSGSISNQFTFYYTIYTTKITDKATI